MVADQFEFRRFGQRLHNGHAPAEQHGHDADFDGIDKSKVDEAATKIAAAEQPDVLAGLLTQRADT